ncbi:unnamed protein product [Onchocerca flexuosa]|uniref:Mitochondrial import receptor subunit TOM7 homolog n=1 Tax=Onchocerca flexuosa TaxID=387005 RepID=A0A183HD65_9BILA|nr:unnamed protein product [Onchocerca flexuosa]
MKLSSAQQNLVRQTTNIFRIFVQWGSVPFIVYLGFRHGADPQPNGEVIPLSLTGLLYGMDKLNIRKYITENTIEEDVTFVFSSVKKSFMISRDETVKSLESTNESKVSTDGRCVRKNSTGSLFSSLQSLTLTNGFCKSKISGKN